MKIIYWFSSAILILLLKTVKYQVHSYKYTMLSEGNCYFWLYVTNLLYFSGHSLKICVTDLIFAQKCFFHPYSNLWVYTYHCLKLLDHNLLWEVLNMQSTTKIHVCKIIIWIISICVNAYTENVLCLFFFPVPFPEVPFVIFHVCKLVLKMIYACLHLYFSCCPFPEAPFCNFSCVHAYTENVLCLSSFVIFLPSNSWNSSL